MQLVLFLYVSKNNPDYNYYMAIDVDDKNIDDYTFLGYKKLKKGIKNMYCFSPDTETMKKILTLFFLLYSYGTTKLNILNNYVISIIHTSRTMFHQKLSSLQRIGKTWWIISKLIAASPYENRSVVNWKTCWIISHLSLVNNCKFNTL